MYEYGGICLALAHPVGFFDDDAGGAMVEHLDHFGFIERQESLFGLFPNRSLPPGLDFFEIVGRFEEFGVVGSNPT